MNAQETKAAYQQYLQDKKQQNADNNSETSKTNTVPIEIPQPFEDTWSPCAS